MTEERDVMEYDVVIVGAGPAGLATAIKLKQLSPDTSVCVLEKASMVGAHSVAGAAIEPGPLDELFPDWRDNPPPVCVDVTKDEFFFMTSKRSIKFPLNPPQMNNHGNYIVSLGAMCAWLGEKAEALEVEIYPGFAAVDALFDDQGAVMGVRVGDMGIDKEGNEKSGYTPGIDIHAKLTILSEGCRGSLSKQLIKHFKLDNESDPQTYGIGFKELWQLPEGRVTPGLVQHMFGWPLDNMTYGGASVYHLDNDRVSVVFVVGLDYQDPNLMPFECFQQFKHHPMFDGFFEGGEIISAGARAISEGGYQSMPKLEMPGALMIGDAAGMLNMPKLKGIHTAMNSGILAAKHYTENKSGEGYYQAFLASATAKELHKVRNVRPGFRNGMLMGLINAGIETVTGGLTPWTLANHADHSELQKVASYVPPNREFAERTLAPRDRLASQYLAATEHDEDQPVHLKVADTTICSTKCLEEYNNPCTRFCPVGVYEMVEDEEQGGLRLQINASNCVHCKTCDIKDPYQIITWVPPEGGSGPNYQNL